MNDFDFYKFLTGSVVAAIMYIALAWYTYG
jgi:hypothetical protein